MQWEKPLYFEAALLNRRIAKPADSSHGTAATAHPYRSPVTGAQTVTFVDPLYTAGMTDHQRAWFYAEYQHARRDEVVGVLLAIFLGTFGIHHFYLRRNGLGLLYLLFSWTGIPAILGFIEAFFMPSRVRRYNAAQAAYISGQIRATSPFAYQPSAPSTPCPACGGPIETGAVFCPHCGIAIAPIQPAI